MTSNMNSDHIRQDQIQAGRMVERETIRVPQGATRFPQRTAKKPNAPKGHEAFLKALEASGATVCFEKISSDTTVVGTIKHSDKYTVSVIDGNSGSTRVLFKHDISEFSPFEQQQPTVN